MFLNTKTKFWGGAQNAARVPISERASARPPLQAARVVIVDVWVFISPV
jgi:hypothetical protein